MEIKLSKKEKIKISYTVDLYEIMRRILLREERFGHNREHFWVVGLSEEYMLLFIELVALGNENKFLVNPNEVFQLAIHKRSTYVILVHNHPGSSAKPSEADIDLTDQLVHAAEMINLIVIEHLILCNPELAKDKFYSFTASGLIKKLQKSKKYAVHYIEEAKILKRGKEKGKEEGIEIGTAKGKKEGKKEGKIEEKIKIARKMLLKKVKTADIADFTGLSEEQITKLSETKKKIFSRKGPLKYKRVVAKIAKKK